MSELGKLIAQNVPKMNRKIVEGFTFHGMQDGLEYVDSNIKYISNDRTKTNLEYLGYRSLLPEEIVAMKLKIAPNRPFNMAPNGLYYVEYVCQYANEPEPRRMVVALPYFEKGNRFLMAGKYWTIMPTILDKVISIGTSQIFIDIATAKYIFNRNTHTVIENGNLRNISVVLAELYKNQSDRLAPTTNAKPTMIHYLLSYYGFSETMKMLLGFVPDVVNDIEDRTGKIVIESKPTPPDNYFYKNSGKMDLLSLEGEKSKFRYKPNRLKFVVDESKDSPEITYVLGNVLYILDHFPNEIDIPSLDDPLTWRRYIGEIIHSGNYTLPHLLNSMATHFKGYTYPFNEATSTALKQSGIHSKNVFELMVVIFKNFNTWITQGGDGSFYHSKRLDGKSDILGRITYMFTTLYFDIYKEECKVEGGVLAPEDVTKIIKKNIKMNTILGIKRNKFISQITEDSTCHLWFKGTAFVNKQERNSVNASTAVNSSLTQKLHASMSTTGNLLYLSKSDTDPNTKINTWMTIDEVDGTILPDPVMGDIVSATEEKLRVTHSTTRITDIADEEDLDVSGDDDPYDLDMYDNDDEDMFGDDD